MVVDGQCSDYKNVISGIPHANGLGPWLLILNASDMWSGLENRLGTYADDATLFAFVPSPLMWPLLQSLNRDLAKISAWCKLWSMKINPTKTQYMTVSRSLTTQPDLFYWWCTFDSVWHLRFLGWFFIMNFLLNIILAQFLLQLRRKLAYWESRLRLLGISLSFRNVLILLCYPVWSTAHLFGALQQVLILHCWTVIWMLSDFLLLVIVVTSSTDAL